MTPGSSNNAIGGTHGAKAGKNSGKPKAKWEYKKTIVLIECKRAEDIENAEKKGRDRCLRFEKKWSQLQKKMQAKLVDCEISQLRDKWKSLQVEYKAITDHHKVFGNGQYFAMYRKERKNVGISKNFHRDYYDLMESFMSKKDTINPWCIAEAFDTPDVEDEQPVQEVNSVDTPSENIIDPVEKS
ncbi:hypothetical protein R1flu_000866 [Riccia fluitans]|uniref:Myb/SANT-like domain-containing protein n=1 Tax=Riccia fluitans TaxID=41844 RepID=A0ABD1Y1N2_9MARC